MLGCPIRKSPDQWLFAPTRSLSQLITSFIASQSLGIHRSLLFAFFILLDFDKSKLVITFFCSYLLRYMTSLDLSLQKISLLLCLSFFQYVKDRYFNV